ncbi:dihydrolipoamide acetyltransferase family protein [Rhodococcus sp. T2V]|uniref:dihydrolipoamide acetyltransferase family protein n=1 Tax=Rhodococcus sp. T2V TaxID=3034164 RepID=UPI0023E2FF10|nr:dihydrolipoamide acetyltransferase family protein [Rhodococcus sp. T2V]MDF3311159.1 dihydrolipoamide acetyltransferase family protein [Rhodococcus sp. T2V]
MPTLLRMPGVAADSTEAILAEWQIPENTPYAQADAIATVETDKAAVDIEAETAGVIIKYLVDPGTSVEVGAPIALTGAEGEIVSDLDTVLRELGVLAEGSFGGPADAPAAAPADTAAAPAPGGTADPQQSRRFLTPLVRRLAREGNLDLTDIVGSGPNGRIVKRDIVALLDGRQRNGNAPVSHPVRTEPAAPQVAPTVPAAPAPAVTGYTEEPHSRIRKAIATRLAESKQTAPHFYVRGSARVDRLLALRKELNEAGNTKVSVNDLVIKAAAQAHTAVPAMNVMWTKDTIRTFDTVDISVAVASERGLVTPVVRNVGQRSISAIASETKDLVARARDGKLRQADLEGGSLSISNLGMFGTEEFAAIINPPQSAILAVGAARQEPVVVDGQLEVGTVIHVTLSVDHRPLDGSTAAEWMRTFLDIVESPMQILL